jgi:hypothetical protein
MNFQVTPSLQFTRRGALPPLARPSPDKRGEGGCLKITMKSLTNILIKGAMLCALALLGQSVHAQSVSTSASPDDVTAIDILLEPDATMLQHAAADNARLLEAYPKGFALDATHTPHITMLQCFVRTADLDKLYAAEEKVLAAAHVTAMKLEAFKRYYIPTGGGLGVAGICAKPTPEILKLQADIIAAAAPFNLRNGPIGAFTAGHENPAFDKAIIDYVSTFEKIGAGAKFNPHVSTGNAPTTYLDQMNAEPFESFTFSPGGAAVYQLGPFGTAAKKLKEWDLKP